MTLHTKMKEAQKHCRKNTHKKRPNAKIDPKYKYKNDSPI